MTTLLDRIQPLLEGVLQRRAKRMAQLVVAEVVPGQRILDVGCGDLRIGRSVADRVNIEWTGIDTVDYRGFTARPSGSDHVHFRTYGGGVLPFAPATFDTVLLAFVLHHCEDPASVFDEAVRVARDRLLIFEAVPRNRVESWIARPYDWFVNRLRSPDIAMPFTFMRREEFVALFGSRGLRLLRAVPVRTHPLALVQQIMFVVEKPAGRE